jgi:hypothetical protein
LGEGSVQENISQVFKVPRECPLFLLLEVILMVGIHFYDFETAKL